MINPTLFRTFQNLQYLPENSQLSEDEFDILREFHGGLLTDLSESGVKIALGADFPRIDAVDEIFYYDELNVFTHSELLKMLINTPVYIFPDRAIGRIDDGYEAHLLILSENPAENIRNIETIISSIKNGALLEIPD